MMYRIVLSLLIVFSFVGCKNEPKESESLKSKNWQIDTTLSVSNDSSPADSQSKITNPDSLQAIDLKLIGTWKVVSLLMNDQPNPEVGEGNMYLKMNEDHSYQSLFRSGAASIKGTWKLTGGGRFLRLVNSEGDAEAYRIHVITDHRLILDMEQLDFKVRIQLKK